MWLQMKQLERGDPGSELVCIDDNMEEEETFEATCIHKSKGEEIFWG